MLNPATNFTEPMGGFAENGSANASARIPVLIQYWQVVLRWKLVIGAIVLACFLGGLILTLLMTPQYTAVSRIEISRDQKKITNVESLEPEAQRRDLEFYQTQYALLAARSLAERVSRELKLASNEEFFAAHGVATDKDSLFADRRAGARSAAEIQKRERAAVKLLMDHVAIVPVRGSSLVDVGYTSASPALSAQIVNMWTAQFIKASMDRRFASTVDARRFLEERLAELRARLEQSERDLVGYAATRGS